MKFCQSAGISVLLAALTFNMEQSWAGYWQHTVSSQITAEFDTNPAMSPTYQGGVWRGLFTPGYTLTGRFGEDEFNTGLALQIARSSDETLILNRESPSAFINWLQKSTDGEFGMSGRYTEMEVRDAGLEATGLSLVTSSRVSRNISAKWSKAFNQRSTLSANGSYEKVSYTGDTFIDYNTTTGVITFAYALNEKSTPFIKISYADYEPVAGGYYSYLSSADAGLHWQSSDNLQGTLQAGRSINNDGETDTQGEVEVKYSGSRMEIEVNAKRQVIPGGLGGFVAFDQANGIWSYALTERSKVGLDLGWRNIHYTTAIINRIAGVWLHHNLNSFWDTRLYYQHRISEQEGVGAASANILGLTFIYTHTDF